MKNKAIDNIAKEKLQCVILTMEGADEYHKMRAAIIKHCLKCRILKVQSDCICSVCPFYRWMRQALQNHPEINTLRWKFYCLVGTFIDWIMLTLIAFLFILGLIYFIQFIGEVIL